MSTFQADPSNFTDLLSIARDGDVLNLTSGDYKGSYLVDKALTIRGTGINTVIFATNEPAIRVQLAGVRFENLAIERTVGGDIGEVALFAEPQTVPILNQVRLVGRAENVKWEGATWNIPAILDFGAVESNRQVERSWEVQIGSPCEIISDLKWLFVQSTRLSPGLQEIKVGLNSRDIPAGTILSGSISLKADDELREIGITATIQVSQSNYAVESLLTPEETTATPNIVSQDWGYRLVGKISERLIRLLEGQATLNHYTEYRDRRDRAEQLIFELAGKQPQLFYVRRLGEGKHPGEEKWELIMATDHNEIELPEILVQKEKTIRFISIVEDNSYRGLKLVSVALVPPFKGYQDSFAVPYHLRLLSNYHSRVGIPREAIQQIQIKPFCGDFFPTEAQLSVWQTFVKIERSLAEARQFCVAFIGHNYGSATRRITFEIDSNSATVDGLSENELSEDELWERVFKARNEDTKLFENEPDEDRRNGITLGYIESVNPQNRFIRIRLDADIVDKLAEGFYQLPQQGFLLFDAAGDIIQIKRKERALQDLEEGRTQNRNLGEFFFDSSQAQKATTTVKLSQNELLLPSANPDQIAAVEAVLSVPDLVLIQGPPGTGKTTVIAEICYQVARRGGRTLIASQANLAVDNALSRLVHSPIIRALRKGKASRVEEEGLPFLEDRVIGTWLQNTADDCEQDLAQRQRNVNLYRQLLQVSERFTAYLATEEEFESKQQELQNQKQPLEVNFTTQQRSYQEAQAQQNEIKSLKQGLDSFLDAKSSVNWEESASINLMVSLKPYLEQDTGMGGFATEVDFAVSQATKLGFTPPNRECFGLAVWLQETVANWLTEVKGNFPYLNEVAEVLKNADSIAQTYLSIEKLQQQESLYQQKDRENVESSQQLEAKIRKIESRKQKLVREEQALNTELEEWKNSVNYIFQNKLKDCFTRKRFLTEDDFLNIFPTSSRLNNCVKTENSFPQILSHSLKIRYANHVIAAVFLSGDRLLEGNYFDSIEQAHRKTFDRITLRSVVILWILLSRLISDYKYTYWVYFLGLESNSSFAKLSFYILKNGSKISDFFYFCMTQWKNNVVGIYDETEIKLLLSQYITEYVTETLVSNFYDFNQKKQSQVEQEIQSLHNQLREKSKEQAQLKAKLSTIQHELITIQQKANSALKQILSSLQRLVTMPQIPESLRNLAQEYLNDPQKILHQSTEFSNQIYAYQSQVSQLERLVSTLNPWSRLETTKAVIDNRASNLGLITETSRSQLKATQNQLRQIETQLQQLQTNITNKRNWWRQTWEGMRNYVQLNVPSQGLYTLNFLRQIKAQFTAWEQELIAEEAYLNRYATLTQDWIHKLRNPSEQDMNELKRIYIKNANVIGITCSQAAGYSFVKEFNNFDVVIIDEVSKCTPPELLIPALKGKKLVLIGDYRQLPPMLNDSTVEEIAEDLGALPEDLSFLEESLFKTLFESADKSIKRRLTIQYRMHPIIMGGINQFYEHRLQCGLLNPDQERAHNLSGEIIQDNHHLLWVNMPIQPGFEEQRDGTSYTNPQEVDVIQRICQQLNLSWSKKVENGKDRKEVGIITFYNGQLRLIESQIENRDFPFLRIRTGTVDRFQGMERPVVIVSMVRNNSQAKVGFAKKPERINVAFSRAQELLIIVGCHSLFTQHSGNVGRMYSEVSNFVRRNGGLIDVSSILS